LALNPKTSLQKSVFLQYIERFLSYLIFYPPEKVATPLTRVEKNLFKIVQIRVLKEAQFCADFKTAQNSGVKREGKFFPRKTDFRDKKTLGTS
jgi:hypothetical protein